MRIEGVGFAVKNTQLSMVERGATIRNGPFTFFTCPSVKKFNFISHNVLITWF